MWQYERSLWTVPGFCSEAEAEETTKSYISHNVCTFGRRNSFEKTFILNAKYGIEYKYNQTPI